MSSPAERIDKAAADARGPLRFVSAASLFDGHDAAINIIRRMLQAHGAEVVHLGHNRSVADIVRAAIQEDADGIAVSSYQGGHNEYFRYMVDMLKAAGAAHIRVVVGGGGTIAPHEVEALEAYGIEKIYTPDDGLKLGLDGMIEDVFRRVRATPRPAVRGRRRLGRPTRLASRARSRCSSRATRRPWPACARSAPRPLHRPPVVGITGTGGAGKSTLTDEILNRVVRFFPDRRVAVVAMDPTRRRSGGALLGDRIRMNALANEQLFMRSLATRRQHLATSAVLADTVQLLKSAGFDLVVVETAGIGQSDTEIVDLVDLSMYVMTADYGAASQLEKIDMLDFADFIVLNKFEKRGAEDALRDVRKQVARNRKLFRTPPEELPVFPTIASQFNDPGVNALFGALCRRLQRTMGPPAPVAARRPGAGRRAGARRRSSPASACATWRRSRRTAATPRAERVAAAAAAGRAQGLYSALAALGDAALPAPLERYGEAALADGDGSARRLRRAYNDALDEIGAEGVALLKAWPARREAAAADEFVYRVRDREVSGAELHRVALATCGFPRSRRRASRTGASSCGSCSPRTCRAPIRTPAASIPTAARTRTRRACSRARGCRSAPTGASTTWRDGQPATRLSTAFDSTTLYGEDPDERPDIYGRIGNSGVSIASLDDMKRLYSGFDLCAPTTSVSMTINGPAPMILAMFMNTAIDQQVERHLREAGRWGEAEAKINGAVFAGASARAIGASCRPATTAPASACWASAATRWSTPTTYARIRRGRAGARARHRAGRHPQGGPGAEHLHLLDRVRAADDGRRAAVLHRQPRAQFLLRVHLRLPHRRGRRQPDLAARLHAGERLHDRRVLPLARHEGRRFRAQPVVLLLQRHGPGVRGDRPRGAAHLGARDARALRRLGRAARC